MSERSIAHLRVLDDDGVVLIASANALQTRYSSRQFDYEFPKALVLAMRAKELVAVGTDGGGLVEIGVHESSRDAAVARMADLRHRGWRVFPPLRLLIGDGDRLLVLPYSQYAMAADSCGRIELIQGLGDEFEVEGGLYQVFFGQLLRPSGPRDRDGARADRSVRFLLTPTAEDSENSVDDVWGMYAE